MHRANTRHLQVQEVLAYKPNAKIPPVDYINESISIYMDIINIFIRLVQILGSSQRRR
jgi:FtsH-binding integral membrane protein